MEGSFSSVTLASALFLVAMLVAVLTVPRKVVIVPVLLTTVFMTLGQQFEVAGARFYFLRIVILVAWARLLFSKDRVVIEFNRIDKAFVIWVVAAAIIIFMPKHRHALAVMPALTFFGMIIHTGGFALDALGTYFLIRHLIRSLADIQFVIRTMIVVCIVLAGFMSIEKLTGRNMFAALGGVSEFTGIRDGRLRCQGPFTHPIHAGNYGATLLPLSLGLWFATRKRLALLGVAAAAAVTVESASSGPFMACVFGVMAFCVWPMRERMRNVRWILLFSVIALHLVMNSPVWWAIARLSEIVGGGGYWRAKLIDQFVNHFSEWWVIGTSYTAHWSPTGSGLPDYPDKMDLTNQFVAEGVEGGLLRLLLFIFVIVRCYQHIGMALRAARDNLQVRFIVWGLGCGLLAYMAAFLAVAGSLQTEILYYVLLGLISAVPAEAIASQYLSEAETAEQAVPATVAV